MPAWLIIIFLVPVIVLAILGHYYCISRVLDGFYEREIKPTQERLDTVEGKLRELTI
jgi:hypothetical protein